MTAKHALAVVHLILLAAIGGPACGSNGSPTPDTLADMEFLAFVAPGPDDEPQAIRLHDFLAESRPGTRILMLNAAAGWCAPCMREASAMPAFAAAYEPRGVAILTAVFQDQNGKPADAAFVRTWVDTFDLTVPALIDGTFQTSLYFDAGTMPANLFVDAETHAILEIATGAETGDDPMKEYRDLLDFFLQ